MPTTYVHLDRPAGLGAVAGRTRGRRTPDGMGLTLAGGWSWLGRGITKSFVNARGGRTRAGGGTWRGGAVGFGGQLPAGIGTSEGRDCGTGGAVRTARFRAGRSAVLGSWVTMGPGDTAVGSAAITASAAAQCPQTDGPDAGVKREHRSHRRRHRAGAEGSAADTDGVTGEWGVGPLAMGHHPPPGYPCR